jgi:hypothetical protein
MFMYELQRQSELERVFQGHVFRLANAEDTANDQSARITKLDTFVKEIQAQLASKSVDERIRFSKIRMDAQELKLNDTSSAVSKTEQKLQDLEKAIADLKGEITTKLATPPPAPAPEPEPEPERTPTTPAPDAAELTDIREDVDILIDSRDALVTLVTGCEDRIARLERQNAKLVDLVCALTLSESSSPGSSPPQTQRLPVQTTNGESYELCVPKGTGLTLRNGTRSPGKPWGA